MKEFSQKQKIAQFYSKNCFCDFREFEISFKFCSNFTVSCKAFVGLLIQFYSKNGFCDFEVKHNVFSVFLSKKYFFSIIFLKFGSTV